VPATEQLSEDPGENVVDCKTGPGAGFRCDVRCDGRPCRRARVAFKVSDCLLVLRAMRLRAPDRKRQLLKTAMQLFSEQGFDGTSTRAIAEAAGVNEALIFRHFRSKEELFWAVLSDRVERRGRGRRIREFLESSHSVPETLLAIAETLLERSEDDAAVTRLLFYSALRNRELSSRFFRTYGQELLDLLADYIRVAMRGSHFRAVNPVVAARSFLGMIVYHYLVEEIFGVAHAQDLSTRELAQQLVAIFLEGVSHHRSMRKNGWAGKTGLSARASRVSKSLAVWQTAK
jgi:AcrR family transcriptional regulator